MGSFTNQFARRDLPIANEDFWMRYFDAEDVELWAVFISERLEHVISTFESRMAGLAIE